MQHLQNCLHVGAGDACGRGCGCGALAGGAGGAPAAITPLPVAQPVAAFEVVVAALRWCSVYVKPSSLRRVVVIFGQECSEAKHLAVSSALHPRERS